MFFSFMRSCGAQICAGTVRLRTTHLVKSLVGALSQVVQVFETIASFFSGSSNQLLCWFVAQKECFFNPMCF